MDGIFFTALYAMAVLSVGVAAVSLSGYFPLASRPLALRRRSGTALIILLGFSAAALLCVALLFGLSQLPWTAVVITGGLAVLASPLVFQLAPASFWDSLRGVVTALAITVCLLTAHTYAYFL